MAFVSDIGSTLERIINKHGFPVSIQLKTRAYSGADYDDEILAPSGAVINGYKGWIQCIDGRPHGDDYAYVQQGLVQLTDKKLYLPGGCPIEENADIVVRESATMAGSFWVVKFAGWEMSGTNLYTTAYLRRTAIEEPATYG